MKTPAHKDRVSEGNGDARCTRTSRPPVVPAASRLRSAYGLSRRAFARMAGVTETTVTRWEEGKGHPGDASARRLQRIESILEGLARVMRRGFIPTWLEQPNDAAKEAGGATPLDVMAKGDFAAIEQMVYFFEAGEPF